jgi:hypothetical protein
MEDNNGTPVDVQVSADATRALVAYKSGSIVKVDTASGAVQTTTCGCTPTGLHRMNASPVFRINEPSGLPLLLVEELDSGPRMWFVPPVVRESANERGEQ